MKLTLIALAILLLLPVCACATESPSPTAPVDKPYLSSNEAIAIAKQQALNHQWSTVSSYAKHGSSKGWSAKYTGNGKWTVELRLRYESGDLTIYRWTVFEGNLTAVYVGAYKGN